MYKITDTLYCEQTSNGEAVSLLDKSGGKLHRRAIILNSDWRNEEVSPVLDYLMEIWGDRPVYQKPAEPKPTVTDLAREYETRLYGGFLFNGNAYQSDDRSQHMISQYSVAAQKAIAEGAMVGDYSWLEQDTEFFFRTADNRDILLDAQDMLNLNSALMTHVNRMYTAYKNLKQMSEIPDDFSNDKYWG